MWCPVQVSWYKRTLFVVYLMPLEEECQIMKESYSALASQWSGTYVHRVHSRGGQEGYRGTTRAGTYGVSRQVDGEANCESGR